MSDQTPQTLSDTELIERAIKSKQPRFDVEGDGSFFATMLSWANALEEQAPDWLPNTQVRDAWLLKFAKSEPHLMGIIHSVVSIDANRGWDIIGGRNQVLRYSEILHNWKVAPGLYGWRPGVQAMASSFYQCDLGGIAEIGRAAKNGPMRELIHVDPTCCAVTGNNKFPLKYTPKVGKSKKAQPWREADYMRVVSMPDVLEEYQGVGYCFVSRILILAQIMVAIWKHDKEELGARAPRGLLLLLGISQSQWEQAMKARSVKLDGNGWEYYNAVAVLASAGSSIDAKLVALSQLPKGFVLQEWVSLYMYGMSLCAGYDPSEFYPVQFGSLGRGTEMEVQHEKASGKGAKNFSLALQEQLQRPDVLPPTLHFEFQERDEGAEIQQAETSKAWVEVYKILRETGLQVDLEGGITREEFRQLCADKGIIPPEWTEAEENTTVSDEDESGEEAAEPETERAKRDRLLSVTAIYRAALAYPLQPILRYTWPGYGKSPLIRVVWESGKALLHRQLHPTGYIKQRQDTSKILYDDGKVLITEAMVDDAIKIGVERVGDEFGQILDNEPIKKEDEE